MRDQHSGKVERAKLSPLIKMVYNQYLKSKAQSVYYVFGHS